ncbi:putative sugar transporter [Talaromyces proteolyticus]|uniref:Sugar transporter n=1 Tax=Talaromyces proteolyticus TaxID=1131652 RepID=A0AAD4KR35_9EURO|nr:putative sugar transporter [Talaromyces proteolyticus]KAH8696407.1 putative sugar transporter [Talaromyces proteolyticus]
MELSGVNRNRRVNGRVHRSGPEQGFNHLLNNNKLGIIDNPINYRPPDELEDDVRSFYEEHELAQVVDIDLLLRGAHLARDREQFLRNKSNYNEVELRALNEEEHPRLSRQPKELQVVLLTCAIGAIVQGWSQANLTGANLLWPLDLFNNNTTSTTWKFGAVNSVTYFSASLVGGWLSDPLNEHVFGRRGALFIAALVSLASSIGSGYVQSWQGLLVCRLIQGIGMGAKASVVPIFESEVSPSKIRGRFLVSWQSFVAFGLFLGSCSNLIFNKDWRWQLASAFIPTVPLLFLVLICSESPHWLVKQNDYPRAWRTFKGLRETPLQAARDMYQLHCQLQVETILLGKGDIVHEIENWTHNASGRLYQQEARRTNFFQRFWQLFTIQRNRRACLAACVVMAAQQLSGINIFAFLSTSFISNSVNNTISGAPELSNMTALWLSFGFALSNAVFSPLAYFTIDSKGRRFLLLLSLILMVPLLIAAGFCLQIDPAHPNNPARVGLFELFLILYTATYSPGAGVVPFLYSSEIFPLVNREVGMSLSCTVNFLLAGVLALTVPQLQSSLGQTRLLGLFAGLDAFAAILVWLFVPGTRKTISLEEFNYIFGVPTRVHIRYQIQKVLPWALKSWIPWFLSYYVPWVIRWYLCCGAGMEEKEAVSDRLPPLEALYQWNSVRRMKNEENEEYEGEVGEYAVDVVDSRGGIRRETMVAWGGRAES